ncbi:MAG: hypothetical protein WBM68_12055 [Woeseia sp.]
MMTRLCLVLTTGVVLASCAASGPADPTAVCEKIKEKACIGDKYSPVVEIKTKWNNDEKLQFKPECVVAAPGTTIMFNIKLKKKSLGSAELSAEESVNGWLNRKNDQNASYIIVNVPAGAAGPYKYNFKSNDLCADPRVHVEN